MFFTTRRQVKSLAWLFLICLSGLPRLHADSCIAVKAANTATKVSVSQDEHGITVRIAGAAKVTGDTSLYTVSSDAGVVMWRAEVGPGGTVSTSRSGGVVNVCQSVVADKSVVSENPPAGTVEAPAPPAVTPNGKSPSHSQSADAMPKPDKEPALAANNQSVQEKQPAPTPPAPAPQAASSSAAASSTLSDPEAVVVQHVQGAFNEVAPAGQTPISESDRLYDAQHIFARDLAPYVLYLASANIPRRILSDAEEKRIDQQVGTTQPSTGTSVASKGSVPWLLGFAAESGALTQSTSNNVLTFNGTPANVIKALKAKNYFQSYYVGADSPLVKWFFTPLSFSLSFNVAQSPGSSNSSGGSLMSGGTGSTATAASNGTFAGGTLRYSILNHRDARGTRYQEVWKGFVQQNAQAMLTRINTLVGALSTDPRYKDGFSKWQQDTMAAITRVDMTPTEVDDAFKERAEALRKIVGNDKVLQNLVDDAAQSIETYANTRNNILNNIADSTAVAFEYTETEQKNLLGNPITVMDSSSSSSANIPNLSTFNFIVEKGSSELGRSQFTANASATIFNSIPAGTHIGRVRDYRVAIETDTPLPEIPSAGMPVLTFSGLFLSLLNQPLGQMVVFNDVPVSLTGNIWLFQSKLSLKIKGSGVQVPVSFTYANRTELNKESDKRGSIGVTYNLDNLFASNK